MNSNEVRFFLEYLNKIIPIPEGFKGNHVLHLTDNGALGLTIWNLCKDGKVRFFPVWFDDREELTRACIEDIKLQIDTELERMERENDYPVKATK